MLTKLKGIEARFEAVESQLSDSAVYADPALLRKLSREQKELEPIVAAYRAYQAAQRDLEDAKALWRRSCGFCCCLRTPTTAKMSSWRSGAA